MTGPDDLDRRADPPHDDVGSYTARPSRETPAEEPTRDEDEEREDRVSHDADAAGAKQVERGS